MDWSLSIRPATINGIPVRYYPAICIAVSWRLNRDPGAARTHCTQWSPTRSGGAEPSRHTSYLVGLTMSSTGEDMPELERLQWLDRVAQDGRALEYAAAELKGDREIVLAAVAQQSHALEYAAAELKRDREIVLVAVAHEGWALKYAPADLKGLGA